MDVVADQDSPRWDHSLDSRVVPLFLALQGARARSLETMRPVLARYGLSLAEFDVLATLRNAPPPHELTPSQLQAEVVITSGGLTKVMLHLEGRGLVLRRQAADDARVKPAALTPAGAAQIEAAMAEVVAATGAWLRAALSDAEMARLQTVLARLAGAG
ncbi:MarR family transcriptional regulator [Zoogloea sp.]|uniref:MarR family winged helix-turn-helix transcriptional regulator n=1 Tax=Zoogloea sp. TaxID=49181 RepID=UPI002C5E69FD|nr:MarR family transcriptional regulator [Zoogloea sp.]HNH16665.1 MarR family transcriptional regulator [Zoogloea sp.]